MHGQRLQILFWVNSAPTCAAHLMPWGWTMEVIRFNVKLDREDWRSFSKVVSRRLARLAKGNSTLFFMNTAAWIPLGIALATYSRMYTRYDFLTGDLKTLGGSVVLGAGLLVLSLMVRNRILRRVIVADNGSALAEHEFVAGPTELHVSGSFGRAVYPWSCFLDRFEVGNVIYLFTDNVQAVVIPLRKVGTEKDVELLRGWINADMPWPGTSVGA
jgi:hypothetical protein